MRICICGGGNLGHVVAGFLAAHNDCEVTLLTRKPERWSQYLRIHTPDAKWLNGRVNTITNKPEEVIPFANIVLLCLPGFAIREQLQIIQPLLTADTAIGSVVCSTGFFFEAMNLLGEQVSLFGFQRVPFISRVIEYGHSAALLGYKSSLSVSIEQTNRKETFRQLLEKLFKVPVVLLKNHYEASLSNSNPLLHPARLYSLWKGWQKGMIYPRVPLFYEEWTEEAAQLYIDMDNELQTLLLILPVTPGCIPPVLDYYESTDSASLSQKLRSIEAFKGITAPMQQVEGGYVPDFHSRYFTEDFPYGLAIVRRLMKHYGIKAPTIEKIYQWGMECIKE